MAKNNSPHSQCTPAVMNKNFESRPENCGSTVNVRQLQNDVLLRLVYGHLGRMIKIQICAWGAQQPILGFACDVIAAMLVYNNNRVVIIFFCCVHQHCRHTLCHLNPWRLNANQEFLDVEAGRLLDTGLSLNNQ